MRKTLLLFFLFSSITASSQKVTIRGTASDTTKGRNWVSVVVNDTLRKFLRESSDPDRREYQQLTEDTSLCVFAKYDGSFRITANLSDSIFFQSFRHKQKVYSVADLLKMDRIDIRLEPEACIPYVPCEDTIPSNFYIFVGQKIKIAYEPEPYYCDVMTMDSRFNVEYKILDQEVGHYSKDSIRFTAFDHYGRPVFSRYEHALLFVSEYCGKLYHEKYQYFELYKTADGKWASPGDPYKYDQYHKKDLVAQTIKFADDVWFDVSKLNEILIKKQYPEPYYKIEGSKAIPVMGSYVDDLITVKKEGVLKARKIKFNKP